MGRLMHGGPIVFRRAGLLATGAFAALLGCQVEKRDLGPAPPITPPTGPTDVRAKQYETNRYEVSEGGRMYRWFGCDGCHTERAPGFVNLTDEAWRQGGSTVEIYRAIAAGSDGMPAYAGRITPQQTWQIAGYVHGLHTLKPNVRSRSDDALKGEPSGASWTGPLP
jgi:cytochrome c oxidase cbb3-type subunit 3